jgi:hypothetical protein
MSWRHLIVFSIFLVSSFVTQTVFGLNSASGESYSVQPLLNDFGSTFSSFASQNIPLKSRSGEIDISLGYMGKVNGIRSGYTGLVLPGTCVSSYFIYDLRGVNLTGEMPIQLSKSVSGRLRGSYLFAMSSAADQDITWLDMPPGTRDWAWTRSSYYGLTCEARYSSSDAFTLIAGFLWNSLNTNFGNPNPDYPFTISDMESGLSVNMYQPFIGAEVSQKLVGSNLLLKVVGFPLMPGYIQHFNTCNNHGTPFAHVGAESIRNGYYVDVNGELSFMKSGGYELSAFCAWELFRGTCRMTIERRDSGPPLTISSDPVDFLYESSIFTLGGKAALTFATPF